MLNDKFIKHLIWWESSNDPSNVTIDRHGNAHKGLYQLWDKQLGEMGLFEDGKYLGKYTEAEFMKNRDAQHEVFQAYRDKLWGQLEENGATSAIGSIINNRLLTPEALFAIAHLGGVNGAKKYIQNEGYDPNDMRTKLSDYHDYALSSTGQGGRTHPQEKGEIWDSFINPQIVSSEDNYNPDQSIVDSEDHFYDQPSFNFDLPPSLNNPPLASIESGVPPISPPKRENKWSGGETALGSLFTGGFDPAAPKALWDTIGESINRPEGASWGFLDRLKQNYDRNTQDYREFAKEHPSTNMLTGGLGTLPASALLGVISNPLLSKPFSYLAGKIPQGSWLGRRATAGIEGLGTLASAGGTGAAQGYMNSGLNPESNPLHDAVFGAGIGMGLPIIGNVGKALLNNMGWPIRPLIPGNKGEIADEILQKVYGTASPQSRNLGGINLPPSASLLEENPLKPGNYLRSNPGASFEDASGINFQERNAREFRESFESLNPNLVDNTPIEQVSNTIRDNSDLIPHPVQASPALAEHTPLYLEPNFSLPQVKDQYAQAAKPLYRSAYDLGRSEYDLPGTGVRQVIHKGFIPRGLEGMWNVKNDGSIDLHPSLREAMQNYFKVRDLALRNEGAHSTNLPGYGKNFVEDILRPTATDSQLGLQTLRQLPDGTYEYTFNNSQPTFAMWDAMKRGFDDLIEKGRDKITGKVNWTDELRQYAISRDKINEALRRISPEYARANDFWTQRSLLNQAEDQGKNIFDNKISPETFTEIRDNHLFIEPPAPLDLNAKNRWLDERNLAIIKGAQGEIERLAGTSNPINAYKEMLDQNTWTGKKLRSLFPDDLSYNQFASKIQDIIQVPRTTLNKFASGEIIPKDIDLLGKKDYPGIMSLAENFDPAKRQLVYDGIRSHLIQQAQEGGVNGFPRIYNKFSHIFDDPRLFNPEEIQRIKDLSEASRRILASRGAKDTPLKDIFGEQYMNALTGSKYGNIGSKLAPQILGIGGATLGGILSPSYGMEAISPGLAVGLSGIAGLGLSHGLKSLYEGNANKVRSILRDRLLGVNPIAQTRNPILSAGRALIRPSLQLIPQQLYGGSPPWTSQQP